MGLGAALRDWRASRGLCCTVSDSLASPNKKRFKGCQFFFQYLVPARQAGLFLDLLFYHRRLRRLVAIELKLGRFKAAHKGQMELYLKWRDKHERQTAEEAPIVLILCAESSREQVELLQMHKDGITVAEYWTELPPKAELEQKLDAALLEARERLARRGVLLGDLDDE